MTKLRHKHCGGDIVEEEQGSTTIGLRCLKCRKGWSAISDLSDIEAPESFGAKTKNCLRIFYQFKKAYKNPILNFLFNERLRRIMGMVDLSSDKNFTALDLGCATGYFTQHLAHRLSGMVIGVDICRSDLAKAKIRARYYRVKGINPKPNAVIEFVHADIIHMPFRNDSVDVLVSVSVLEHINNLKSALTQIKNSMKKGGTLVAGYPIETNLFRALIRLFISSDLRFLDPCILGKKQYEKSPDTHKQYFKTIRGLLQKHFSMVHKEKGLFTILPDLVSYYECVKMIRVN